MPIKSQRILPMVLVVASVCIAIYVTTTRRDTSYVSSTLHPDGSFTVNTIRPPLRYGSNNEKYQHAIAAIGRHDFISAEGLFRRIVERTPDELAALHGLASTLLKQDRYEESRKVFEQVLWQDPHFYNAHAGLGAIETAMRRYPEAVEQYSLALKENPTSALAYYGRGVAYLLSGKRTEALADLNKVLELAPTSSLAVKARAFIESF